MGNLISRNSTVSTGGRRSSFLVFADFTDQVCDKTVINANTYPETQTSKGNGPLFEPCIAHHPPTL